MSKSSIFNSLRFYLIVMCGIVHLMFILTKIIKLSRHNTFPQNPKKVTLMIMLAKKSHTIPRKTKVALILVPILLVFGAFGYNKYLDWQNVNDMKQLLADFEQLKQDVETETGEELTIEADCGSGGKFATFYSCKVSLKSSNGNWIDEYEKIIVNTVSDNLTSFGECRMLSERSVGFEPKDDYYFCSFYVNNSNKNKAESIFYQYDTSPGSPY